MKIGILTWYYALNHGARAHTYALVNTLRNMGYDAEVIAYHSWNSYISVEPYWVITKNIPLMIRRMRYRYSFKMSEKDYKYLSKPVHSAKKIDDLGYDLIILGSDEIFNINHLITSNDYTYFGVGIEKTPTVTYAVSCGQSDEKTIWPENVVDSIRKIRFLSVRDSNSQRIIESNVGKKAELVLDPTLLFDFSKLADKEWKHRDYVLIYAFGFIDDYKEQIISFAKENKYKIVCLGNKYEWANINIDYPTQNEWYAAFVHAKVVITNSFHGTIFAIKNRKQFYIITMEDKVTKIADLLQQIGIDYEDRLLQQSGSIKISEVNYASVYERLEKNKEKSINVLQRMLTNV